MLNIPNEIKALLNEGCKKNFRVHFPNGEHTDITNENIVTESVSFTESICSQSELKFGLCESPYIEFETFGIGKIKGCTIECSIEVLQADNTYYSIPLGTFVVDSCKKQADMSHRKIVAYSINNVNSISFSDKVIESAKLTYNNPYKYDVVKRVLTYMNDIDVDTIGTATQCSMATSMMFSNGAILICEFGGYWYWMLPKVYSLSSAITYADNNLYISKNECEFDRDVAVNGILNVLSFLRYYDVGLGYKVANSCGTVVYSPTETFAPIYSNKSVNVIYPFMNSKSSENNTANIGFVCGYTIYKTSSATSTTYEFVGRVDVCEGEGTISTVSSDYFGKYFLSENRAKEGTKYKWTNTWKSEDVLKYIEAFLELEGMFGKVGRSGNFELLDLKEKFSALYPSETLYPSNSLYPNQDVGDILGKSNYQSIWYDDEYSIPIGAVECLYMNGTVSSYKKVYASGYSDNTQVNSYEVYSLSDNELIKGNTFTDTNMQTLLVNFLTNASGISYMPSEITMNGRPDLEVGDVLEVQTTDETITTVIMQRTINGIQNLVDSIRST